MKTTNACCCCLCCRPQSRICRRREKSAAPYVPHCIEELSTRGCIKNINILLFVPGIQNNAYENTYIYIQFCVCVRGWQSVALPACVCVCLQHIFIFSYLSFKRRKPDDSFKILAQLSAAFVTGSTCASCSHTQTRTAHTHTSAHSYNLAYLLN